ncbi:head decoration protein [uncultured Desulfuromusa sp.]|uniref:head decoration protein n=1 Tax=uncultured Desulfuromusa sp. TaxID=219183 RepID=UPI002AA770E9|nr:head decoration protein [uncultured Desulfuromusa sp.]
MADLETYTPDNLIAGDFPLVTGDGTILTGQTLVRGTVLAKDSGNDNKLVIVDSASGTASIQAPVAVLAQDVDASAGDAVAPLYLAGEFTERSLTFGGTDTADTHRDALRDLSIFIKKTVAA